MVLSDLSIKRPVLAAVMALVLVVLGIFSYSRLSIEMNPNVEIPFIIVVTQYPGASPEAVEREVSKPLESAVNAISGVKHVYSYSREGISTVVVEFRLEEKVNEAAQEVRARISAARNEMPKGIEEPVVQKFDINSMPVVSLALSSRDMTARDLTILAEKKIKKRFENISGIGKVDLVGDVKREVNITLDPVRMESLGLGVDAIILGLQQENINTPIGRFTQTGSEQPLRVSGKPARVDQFTDMIIAQNGSQPIRISDIANVTDGVEEQRSLALVNGKQAVAIDIYKQSGKNTVKLADDVKKIVTVLKPELPAGVELSVVRDSSTAIRESVFDVQETLVTGGILTILIVFFFINSWRSTVITGVTLPISVIASFIVMYFLNMSLNMMTLMALSLSIGLLIDDAIVVRENIVRHLEMGKDHMSAARDGTSEIGLAVIATTFSIMAVFIPVAFMKGHVGRFFFQFGITVAFAVLVSLFVSFTLDPMLSSRWHDPSIDRKKQRRGLAKILARFNDWFTSFADRYGHMIEWSLKHRLVVVIIAIGAFASGILIFKTLDSTFMPSMDRNEFQVNFKTAPDASYEETKNRLNLMLSSISGIPEIKNTYATIGGGEDGTVRRGNIYIQLTDKSSRKKTQFDIEEECRKKLGNIPGVISSVENVEEHGAGMKPLQVNLRGSDIPTLKEYGFELKKAMAAIPGIVDVEMSMDQEIPEYKLIIDHERASDAGLKTADISRYLAVLIGGQAVSTYEDEDGDSVDIRLRLPEDMRRDPSQIKNLKIAVPGSEAVSLIPLANLVSYDVQESPDEINREDLERQVTISANLDNLALGKAIEITGKIISGMKMEPGYKAVFSGEAQDMEETFVSLMEALILAVIFVFLILAAQFESFLDPLAIMLSLPLSIVGMAGMLLITGDAISLVSLIGLILLMGLVTKNAILLVDYAKTLRKTGMGRNEALIASGRTRLRPIIMTTTAMIFGMIPLALSLGSGSEMRAPMARGVIGGLITSTILTLFVVPVAYSLLDDLKNRIRKKTAKE
jgi:hydrophobic/amphiphilic exporter-1 (mainly G- bacteria), HAE1 family